MDNDTDLQPRSARGMSDMLPRDMRAFRRVEDAFRTAASRWGYGEVRTPTLESYSLFTEAGALTTDMLSRIYTFLDWDGWSGERVVLRPDSTVPVARAAAEHSLRLPARLFYVQNSFRFVSDETGAETWQCGLEYIGAPARLGDLEIAAIGCEVLESVGGGALVDLSHAGVTQGLLRLVEARGAGGPELAEAVTAQGMGALADAGVPEVTTLLNVALQPSADVALLTNLSALAAPTSPMVVEAAAELSQIALALQAAGRDVRIDLGMPADFEYYTGPVLSFQQRGREVGRGGRYRLCGALGSHSAAGMGLDTAAIAEHGDTSREEALYVAVIPDTPADYGRAMVVARTLHRNDIPASLEEQADGPVSLRVSGAEIALWAEGKREKSGQLEDLVPLLLRYK
ncbi:MAG: ATP phosphoribosyltransferase regulatory subunit [Dehalococcoidia bacterium]|nr:ATP phosphoribosyltransferase regulatory subunit [Dehalococcoidia bacterium]